MMKEEFEMMRNELRKVNLMQIYSKLRLMKDFDRQQHLEMRNKGKLGNDRLNLPVSEMAETDALGGCCSK